jgi:hypothetical protein
VLNMCNLCAAIGKAHTVMSDEPQSNEQRQNTGEGLELTQKGNNDLGNVLQRLCYNN